MTRPASSYPGSTIVDMSDAAAHDDDQSVLIVVGPKDAIRRARPLPPFGQMGIEDLTDEESDAFIAALEAL